MSTAESPSPELLRLHQAGTTLANIAFNLAQRRGETLSEDMADGLVKFQREWDQACAAFKASRVQAAARAAAQAETAQAAPAWCSYCGGAGDVHGLDGEWRGECTECPVAITRTFKNFHANLCKRFGYAHDEKGWQRDLVSLEEHIAKLVAQAAAVKVTGHEEETFAMSKFASRADRDAAMLRTIASLRAANGELAGAAIVPDGLALVPLEPTEAMRLAGAQYAECGISANAVFGWRAMLAAATPGATHEKA